MISIGCPDAHDMQQFVQSVIDEKLPIWSICSSTPMAELKNRAPLMEHYGHPAEERVLLPASYIATLAFREKDADSVTDRLPALLKPCQAEILSDRIAQHEWENRFKIMVVKRLGPSLVPAEVVVPLSVTGRRDGRDREEGRPAGRQGGHRHPGRPNGKPEVVILGFIPSDQRKFSYNFVFGLSLTIMKIAEKHGGRPYATGLYFAGKADEILGDERVSKTKGFQDEGRPQEYPEPGQGAGEGLHRRFHEAGRSPRAAHPALRQPRHHPDRRAAD